MNWLAHLLLSEPTPAFRIGNLLPDMVSIRELANLAPEYQRGIQQHRRIDGYTDAHPIFRRSILRLGPEFRRYGGILTDMFYDHFLSRNWSSFSGIALPDFASEVYESFENHWEDIPVQAHPPLHGMRKYDWLCSYGDLQELSKTLTRIGKRFRRQVDLAASMAIFEKDYDAFQSDFTSFFPELLQHVSGTPCSIGQT